MKKSYEKDLADKLNYFVKHYESVSSNNMNNINSLIEDIISSVFRKDKINSKVRKNKQWFKREWLTKQKGLKVTTKALNQNHNNTRWRQKFYNFETILSKFMQETLTYK